MKALIFGACGQDGPYLATHLIEQGYEVIGSVPAWDARMFEASDREPRMRLVAGDLRDPDMPASTIQAYRPDEVYNLAAITYVPDSWTMANEVGLTNALPVTRMLEAIRLSDKPIRFYQASTSEMFGASPPPQREDTPLLPVSPYGAAKAFGHHIVNVYRESYGIHAVSGILFNHESRWRGPEFVTRYVARCVARAARGDRGPYPIGNLSAVRDWGHADDYTRAIAMMLHTDTPKDYVVATGVGHTVRELVDVACSYAGVPSSIFIHDPSRLRQRETADLVGDSFRIRSELGWTPRWTFRDTIDEMVQAELDTA